MGLIGDGAARWTCPTCLETVSQGPLMRSPETWLRAVQRRHGEAHGGRLRRWAIEGDPGYGQPRP